MTNPAWTEEKVTERARMLANPIEWEETVRRQIPEPRAWLWCAAAVGDIGAYLVLLGDHGFGTKLLLGVPLVAVGWLATAALVGILTQRVACQRALKALHEARDLFDMLMNLMSDHAREAAVEGFLRGSFLIRRFEPKLPPVTNAAERQALWARVEKRLRAEHEARLRLELLKK